MSRAVQAVDVRAADASCHPPVPAVRVVRIDNTARDGVPDADCAVRGV